MQYRTLWHLVPNAMTGSCPVAEVLHTHLMHSSLTAVLMQIGGVQRLYLGMDGCDGCADGRCLPGCRADLLRRALRARGAGELSLVPEGLVRRPYTDGRLALPGKDSQPLDSALLRPWSDARLVLHWGNWRGKELTAMAVLLTSGECDPLAALLPYGWQTFPLLGSLRPDAARPIPTVLPVGKRWQAPPYLPLPIAEIRESPPESTQAEQAPAEVDGMLAGWLRAAIDQPAQAQHEAAAARQEPVFTATVQDRYSHWPVGPGGMPPEVLGELIAQILAEPTFRSTRRGQSGITKGRLTGLRHPALSEANARSLMVWLDRASLLMQPEDGQSAWRAPRVFITDDLDAIAEILHAIPLPTPDEVRSAYGGDS